jgi:hypothetical protein
MAVSARKNREGQPCSPPRREDARAAQQPKGVVATAPAQAPEGLAESLEMLISSLPVPRRLSHVASREGRARDFCSRRNSAVTIAATPCRCGDSPWVESRPSPNAGPMKAYAKSHERLRKPSGRAPSTVLRTAPCCEPARGRLGGGDRRARIPPRRPCPAFGSAARPSVDAPTSPAGRGEG